MLAGATLADPARIDIRGDVQVGRDVFIDVNAVFIGTVRLGAGVKIGPNCVIGDSADRRRHRDLRQQHRRPCAWSPRTAASGPSRGFVPIPSCSRDVHIGNFVEIKNSEIGAGSKANHLSYVGDSRVGSGVNVGAGSITCNYDGENKWPTVIEDGAFIGSGTMMVAPVRIGAGATIGAGSTITQNAPDGELTLTRARQTTIAGWARPRKLEEDEKAAAIDNALNPPKPP